MRWHFQPSRKSTRRAAAHPSRSLMLLHRVPRHHARLVLTGEDLVAALVPIEQVLADPEHRLAGQASDPTEPPRG